MTPKSNAGRGRRMWAHPADIHGQLDCGLMSLSEKARGVPHEVVPVAVFSLSAEACEARRKAIAWQLCYMSAIEEEERPGFAKSMANQNWENCLPDADAVLSAINLAGK